MNFRQKARDLIELAADERTPEKERVVAAVKAVALIRKYDLLSSPLDGLIGSNDENVKAAVDVFERLTDPDLVGSLKKISSLFGRKKRRRSG